MTTDIFAAPAAHVPSQESAKAGSLLRAFVVAVGLAWSIAFVAIGLGYQLQMYGDGSVFSYAVAVQDAWGIHWHNIAVRLSVYLSCLAPAELYVRLTGDAHGGVVLYGLLHFAAPLLGLAATFALDRSRNRVIFAYACASTASLCPLVFGAPTEMWLAHTLFWPTLALCHTPRGGWTGALATIAVFLAFTFTHEGAVVLATAIIAMMWMQRGVDRWLIKVTACFAPAMVSWIAVKMLLRPDAYTAAVMYASEMNFFNPRTLLGNVTLLLAGALAGYGALLIAARRLAPHAATLCATVTVAALLGVYWLWFDQSLHTQERYFLRTVLLLGTLLMGMLAAAHASVADGGNFRFVPALARSIKAATRGRGAHALVGALALITLVHLVETAKFVRVWSGYRSALRTLAGSDAADPALGSPDFVASTRIDADPNRASWSSTTPFLSVLVAPGMTPRRLVVDPSANYFWMSCAEATKIESADGAVPLASRRLIRTLECLHR